MSTRQSTAVHVPTDPFPQIYQGIPVRIRDIRLKIDRPETIINPTNCDPMTIGRPPHRSRRRR